MQQGVAKFADFMPEQQTVEVYGKSDGKNFIIYLPKQFFEKRCEIIPDFNSGKMIISILPKNYDGGVKVHKTERFNRPTAYVSFGGKWFGKKFLKVVASEYKFDGKKIVVDIEQYVPAIAKEDQTPAADPVAKEIPVDEIIQMSDTPKKIAIACIRQLNKFAEEHGYRFLVEDGKLSMAPDEVLK